MTISTGLIRDAWSPESNLPLVLLEITHDDLVDPIYLVNNKTNITSNSNEYIGYPFDIILPDSKDDTPPTAKISIDNVSRELGQTIRSMTSPPSVTIKIIRQETPDVIEAEFSGMKIRTIPYDALTIEGHLEFEDLTREPFPSLTFSPSNYPGVL